MRDPLAVNYVDMMHFRAALQTVYLTPELFYRMVDEKRLKNVRCDEFGQRLSKFRIGRERVDRLVILLDKNKSGSINYNYYQACLQAFQINSEVFPSDAKFSYPQIATRRIAYFCRSKIKQLQESLDTDKQIDFADFRFFIQKQVPKIEDIELMAMFIQQDKGNKMKIAANKLLDIIRSSERQLVELPAYDQRRQRQPLEPLQLNQPTPKNSDKRTPHSISESSDSDLNMEALYSNLLTRAKEKEGDTMFLKRTLTLNEFQECLKSSGREKPTRQKYMSLFKSMNIGQRGSLSVQQMWAYSLLNLNQPWAIKCLILIMANVLQTSGLAVEDLFEKRKIKNEIRVQKLQELLQQLDLNIDQEKLKTFYGSIKTDRLLTTTRLSQIIKI